MRTRIISLGLIFAAACGGDDGGNSNPDAGGGGGDGGGGDGTGGCSRALPTQDRNRFVVVARPYTDSGSSRKEYEVLELTPAGALTRFSPPRTFVLGARTPFGQIAFTPNGEVGIVAMDNGHLGVFRLDGSGTPTVVHEDFVGEFYAQRVVMDPSGERAWIVDRNTRNNGGGIYAVSIACDGTLTDDGLVVAGNVLGGFGFVGNKAVVAGREVLASGTGGNDVHLLDWGATPSLAGGADAFGDDAAMFSGFALSPDGTKAFIGDSNIAGTNRVAIVDVSPSSVTPVAVLPNIIDPTGIAVSPFGDVAVVSSSQPEAGANDEGIHVLDKGGAGGTWRVRGELAYVDGKAVLPGDMVPISRGALDGNVLVAELTNIRRLVFQSDGSIVDAGSTRFDSGSDTPADIIGAIGVQP